MYLMNRDFEIGRARMKDRLRRAERARIAAEALAGGDGRANGIAHPLRAFLAPDEPAASPAICDATCDQASVACDAA